MKDINTIKTEIANIEEKIDETICLYKNDIYDEETYKTMMARLNSAKMTLEWVIK